MDKASFFQINIFALTNIVVKVLQISMKMMEEAKNRIFDRVFSMMMPKTLFLIGKRGLMRAELARRLRLRTAKRDGGGFAEMAVLQSCLFFHLPQQVLSISC